MGRGGLACVQGDDIFRPNTVFETEHVQKETGINMLKVLSFPLAL